MKVPLAFYFPVLNIICMFEWYLHVLVDHDKIIIKNNGY